MSSPWCEHDQLEVNHPQVVHYVGAVLRKKVFHQLGVLQEQRQNKQMHPQKQKVSYIRTDDPNVVDCQA